MVSIARQGPRMRAAATLCTTLVACAGPTWPTVAAEPLCPARITVEQHVVDPPAGFRPFDRQAPHDWVNAEFADGPPEDLAWLAPDSTLRKGNTFTNVWTFGQTGRGTFISCAYAGTSVELVARLPDGIKRCEIRYGGPASAPEAKAISCK